MEGLNYYICKFSPSTILYKYILLTCIMVGTFAA